MTWTSSRWPFPAKASEKKIVAEIEAFIAGQYLALHDVHDDFRKRIATSVFKRYGKTVSGERLRQVFREVDTEVSGPATAPSCAAGEAQVSSAAASDSALCADAAPVPASDGRGAGSLEVCPDPPPASTDCMLTDGAVDGHSEPPADACMATNRCAQEAVSRTAMPVARKYSCAPPCAPSAPIQTGLPLSGFDPRSEPFMVHHAGQILFSPFLACLAFHTDNYYDLRERVFMVVERFNQLCAEAGRWGRTWVIDRGIFGLGIFAGFRRYGDALITWEKGYKRDAWDDSRPSALCRRCRERNRPGDLPWWQFCSQESRWQIYGS